MVALESLVTKDIYNSFFFTIKYSENLTMSYPIVNKKRYKLLGYNNDDDNTILQYIQYIRYKEKSLQSIDIPKKVYGSSRYQKESGKR